MAALPMMSPSLDRTVRIVSTSGGGVECEEVPKYDPYRPPTAEERLQRQSQAVRCFIPICVVRTPGHASWQAFDNAMQDPGYRRRIEAAGSGRLFLFWHLGWL